MRRTTTAKLQKIISDNLVSVTSAVVNYDDRGSEAIPVEKFKEDLEFYANSGIFECLSTLSKGSCQTCDFY